MLVVKLLGQFNIQLNDRPIDLPSRPAQTLFAYLILNPHSAQRRERLAGMLWPDASESNARSNLRHALWRIRKALDNPGNALEYFQGDDLTISFSPASPYQLDVKTLEKKVDAATPLAELKEVVSAYGGEFLPGFYDDWITLERERLQAAFEQKMELYLERLVKEHAWREMIEPAERWIALCHAPEPAYRALMSAHYKLGNRAGVKIAYQRCVEALQAELGVPPSEQTQALYQRLTSSQPLGALPTGAAELTVAPTQLPPHNLPPQITPLIGRGIELAEIAERLVNDPTCRLLTIVGPGGIGKTRLAIQAAFDNLAEFPDGVCFVSVAPTAIPDDIPTAILQAASFPAHEQKNPRVQVVDYWREKQALLVLDNLEHLLAGVDVLGEILAAAPGVKIIATSRERLHLSWEWLYELHGLEFPREAGEAAENFSAVQLFVRTARRIRARFTLADEQPYVTRICQLVEGMPLGIELAASWVRVLSCREIIQQLERSLDVLSSDLRDIPDRHRSIRAAFEYSWNLLMPEEQAAFMKLAVFPNGFRRDAAEKVAGAPLSLLFTLVDKSLLRADSTGRYDMHSLLHQYVGEKLRLATEEALVQTRLIHYYLDFARQHQHGYVELEEEWINLMTCAQLAHENWMAQAVLDYADALSEVLSIRGRFTDARRLYAWACEAAQAHDDERQLADYLRKWGEACIEQGDFEEAEQHLQSRVHLIDMTKDIREAADTQYHLARIAIFRSDYATARRLLSDSYRLFERLQDTLGLAQTIHQQALLLYYTSDFAEAERLAGNALELWTQLDAPVKCIRTLDLLAVIALHGMQKLADAERYCWQALQLCDQLQEQSDRTSVLYTLAEVHRRLGRLREARSAADTSLILARQIGDRKTQAHAYFRLSEIDGDFKDYAKALDEAQRSLSLCLDLQDLWGAVYVQAHLGNLHAALQQLDLARTHWAEALARAEPLHHPAAAELHEHLSRS